MSFCGLLADRRDQMRMRVAERIDRDARGEIEIALAVGRDQPGALAPLEGEVDPRIGRQQMRRPVLAHRPCNNGWEMKCAASPGGTFGYFIAAQTACQHGSNRACDGLSGVARRAQHCEKCGCLRVRKCNMWT